MGKAYSFPDGLHPSVAAHIKKMWVGEPAYEQSVLDVENVPDGVLAQVLAIAPWVSIEALQEFAAEARKPEYVGIDGRHAFIALVKQRCVA